MRDSVLDPRAQEILRNVVANYILTGEPVGSRTIARMSREGLSPASIRNVMSDLEEMGLLTHPHTSAGRIPTDKGYRYYVDSLLPAGRLPLRERTLIDESLAGIGGELSEAREVIPRLLSRLTSQVGYFVSPPLNNSLLKHIEFMQLHDRRVLVVFVDRSGVVAHRILETEEDYSQGDLDRAGRYLVSEFAGKSLLEIRARLVALMAEEKAAFDTLVRNAITLGTSYLEAESDESRLVLQGTSNIMKHPEFADMDTMRKLFKTFEEKHRLVSLLDRCLDRSGVRVLIGSETDDPALDHLSLVSSPYHLDDKTTGLLGILGPTRMEYHRAVVLVDYISRLLSTLLTRHLT
jgi:heat-inducible transcriptional repressor